MCETQMPSSSPLLIDIGQGLYRMIGLPLIASWTTKERPKKAKTGTFGFNLQTNNLEYWNGSYWLAASMEKI
jgi:hypothetical protein